MQKLYFILIGSVFLLSILFAIIIWRQTIKFEKKALAAKKAKEEYLNQLRLEQEKTRKIEELKLQDELQKKLQEEEKTNQNTDTENIPEDKPEDHK